MGDTCDRLNPVMLTDGVLW